MRKGTVIKYRYTQEGGSTRFESIESYKPETRLDRYVMDDSKGNPVYERDIVKYANRTNETMDLIVLFDEQCLCWGLYHAEYLEYPYTHLRYSEKHKIVVHGILPLGDKI